MMGRVRTGKAQVSRGQCKPGAGTVLKRTPEVEAEAWKAPWDDGFSLCVGFSGEHR